MLKFPCMFCTFYEVNTDMEKSGFKVDGQSGAIPQQPCHCKGEMQM